MAVKTLAGPESAGVLSPDRLKELGDAAASALAELRSAQALMVRQDRELQTARARERDAASAWERASSELRSAIDGDVVSGAMSS